ncbi:unnamed protein product, partial [Staurois parvus]
SESLSPPPQVGLFPPPRVKKNLLKEAAKGAGERKAVSGPSLARTAPPMLFPLRREKAGGSQDPVPGGVQVEEGWSLLSFGSHRKPVLSSAGSVSSLEMGEVALENRFGALSREEDMSIGHATPMEDED